MQKSDETPNGEPAAKKDFRPNILAQDIAGRERFSCFPIDEGGKGVRLWVYQGGVFRPHGEAVARSMTHETMGSDSRPQRIDAVVQLLKESSKQNGLLMDPLAHQIINVKNGMLDIASGELREHSPEYKSTFQIQADYMPDVKSELVDRFLSDVFPSDALPLAEELLGYLLLPTTKHQKAFILLGEGANGKSTFLSMLTQFLGDESISNVSLQDLVENRFVAAELQGKLANIYADLPSASLEQSDVFKAIVGGDTIKAERKFGQPFKLKTTARLLFSANELPRSRDLTYAYFRRWVIIPFLNKFEGSKAIKDLPQRLATEEAKSALLNRALTGLRRLEAAQGFSKCPSVQEAGEQYRLKCDSALAFIDERLETKQIGWVGKKDLYEAYKGWCQDAGIPHPASQTRFNERLQEVLGAVEGREEGKRAWRGVGWKADA